MKLASKAVKNNQEPQKDARWRKSGCHYHIHDPCMGLKPPNSMRLLEVPFCLPSGKKHITCEWSSPPVWGFSDFI